MEHNPEVTVPVPRSLSSDRNIPIKDFTRTSENWRGKNDPSERRRIQNRLNQRAFRQRRQREGPSSARIRAMSGPELQQRGGNLCRSSQEDDTEPGTSYSEPTPPLSTAYDDRAASAPNLSLSSDISTVDMILVWDELAQLINRNFMAAAEANAQHLNLTLTKHDEVPGCVPRREIREIPNTLIPVHLQYQIPHDPIIDIIPHSRLRFNILEAIAANELDANEFSKCLRASGALEKVNDTWLRSGLVVWGASDDVSSWEMSEGFIVQFEPLVRGCEDLIAATNDWRDKRGEALIPVPSNRGRPR
ncbi:Hypothetical protein R9X50_00243800 [Acrodontium crateriforme]|uniref:BZIP domain-containing protein n=1 Tax=Acrodontium crateriforme TaxID=150365 RepID=A0AAQ3M4A1_9PEZI|nr:Hypothetical protein R9X50_00243800 [Acrodontium crateriforme]